MSRGTNDDVTWGDNVIYADFSGRGKQTGPARTGVAHRSSRGRRLAFRTPMAQWLYNRTIENCDEGRIKRGEKYLEEGKVIDVETRDGMMFGRVQGTQLEPFFVTIRLPHRGADDIESVLSWMVDNPSTLEDLKRGHLPEGKLAQLLCADDDDLSCNCSCPDPMMVCKHVVALSAQVARDIDETPMEVMELRGLREPEFHARIQQLLRKKAERQRQKVEAARHALQSNPKVQFGSGQGLGDAGGLASPVHLVEADFWGNDLPRVELPQPDSMDVLKETDQSLLHDALKPTCIVSIETIRAVSDLEECWQHLLSCQELADRNT